MNAKEAAQIIAIMQANYPDSFRGQSDKAVNARIRLWARMFEADSYDDVSAAVMMHMAADTGRFMPPVGVIKDSLAKLRCPEEMTEQEAWACVSRALRNGLYGAAEEFQRLPEAVRRMVGSPAQLREWAMMDTDTLNSVVASNFQRSYRARAKSTREMLATPECVRRAMAQLAEGLAMLELPERGGR